jgi:glycosyltransferase involved in cell wall biosynthesis
MAERWLVICHEMSNSGAPRVLLEVLRGVQSARGSRWGCEILACRGGALRPEFARLGPVHVLSHHWAQSRSLFGGLWRKFVDRPWIQPRRFASWMTRNRGRTFDLVYNNTTTNSYVVAGVRSFGSPILTHVHELGYAMRRFNAPADLAQTLDNTDYFLAVSSAVAADLLEAGVSYERIRVTPNFLTTLPSEPTSHDRTVLREQLNLPLDAWIVAGCGHIDWLKGPDLFVEAAAILASKTSQKVRFVWLGGVTDRRIARQLRRQVRRLGLETLIKFPGPVPDAAPWLAASDLVAVTSRYESFSLVAMEAGALARPVIAFQQSRGTLELLGNEPGLLVPKMDSVSLAATMFQHLTHPSQATEYGQRLRVKIAANFMAGPRIQAISTIADALIGKGRS